LGAFFVFNWQRNTPITGISHSAQKLRTDSGAITSSMSVLATAQPSATALQTPHSRIRELAELAMTMPDVSRLYFGESNLHTPDFIKQAAEKALADGFTFYTENAGLPSTRAAISDFYANFHGVDIDPGSRIVVTIGGTQAIHSSMRCLLDPGDEAVVLTPAWVNQTSSIRLCNAIPKEVPLILQDGKYQMDREALTRAVTPKTKLIFYTSPSNPLGWVATDDDQAFLLEFARRRGLWLVADEVYERLYYAGSASRSILSLAQPEDAVVVINSFSKNYCMTGWRLGWLVMRADLAGRAARLNEFFISHANSFVQKAAEVALRDGEPFLKNLKEMLQANRDFAADFLRTIPGFQVPAAGGAFYLFPKVEQADDSFAFCKEVLLSARVGLAPGVAFGAGGEGSVRICYAAERSLLTEGLQRLRDYVIHRV
jgi:aspartate aminotransferase